jgi:hypothetical protein
VHFKRKFPRKKAKVESEWTLDALTRRVQRQSQPNVNINAELALHPVRDIGTLLALRLEDPITDEEAQDMLDWLEEYEGADWSENDEYNSYADLLANEDPEDPGAQDLW